MKIYTGGGDRGWTSLFSGERVRKSDARIAACGDVDELNAVLGALEAALASAPKPAIAKDIREIQFWLFHVGAWLATTPESKAAGDLPKFGAQPARTLEAAIDLMQAHLPPLKQFILPGGHMTAALAHLARTVCRRAERHVSWLLDPSDSSASDDGIKDVAVYLNRLSDYLFMLARNLNHLHGVADVPWQKQDTSSTVDEP